MRKLESELVRFTNSPTGAGATALLVFAAGLVNFVTYNGYPVFTVATFLTLLAALPFILPVCILYAKVGGVGRTTLVIVLAMLALELLYQTPCAIAWAAGATLLLRTRMMPLVALLSVAIIVTTPFLSSFQLDRPIAEGADQRSTAPGKPALVHLVLDEHIGFDGLAALPGQASELKEAWQQLGFRLYGGVYSQHFHTKNSLPAAMNFSDLPPEQGFANGRRTVTRSKYFDQLADQGYSIDVMQSSWLDFCQHKAVSGCRTYPASGPWPLQFGDMDMADKVQVILAGLVRQSRTLTVAARLFDRSIQSVAPDMAMRLDVKVKTSTLSGAVALAELIARASNIEPGEALFAHALVPHWPMILDTECRMKPAARWEARHYSFRGNRQEREQAYVDQLSCTLKRIGNLVEAIEHSPARDNYIVIVHSDHGSRIVQKDPLADRAENIAASDLTAAYSTLFAVRSNGLSPGYVDQPVSLSAALEAFASGKLQATDDVSSTNQEHFVWLENKDWEPVQKHPYPPLHPAENSVD